jgi:methylated-DNA-[protein]-cysteine S-methyltransferase
MTSSDRKLVYATMESALGKVWLASTSTGLFALSWSPADDRSFLGWVWSRFGQSAAPDHQALQLPIRQLTEYFQGRRTRFQLPLDLTATSTFDRLVLEETSLIPYGQTLSYGEIARRINRPKAARAVGGALGRNPLPLVIPCHRVLTSQGKIGGFSGGGPTVKQWLLEFEKAG